MSLHKGQKVTIMNNGMGVGSGWTGFPCEVVSPTSWVGSNQTEVKALAPRPDRPSGYGDSWDEGTFHWNTDDLRPTLSDRPADYGVQHQARYTLTITGAPFVSPDAPDFMVDATGTALQSEIDRVLKETADTISSLLFDNYVVTFE